MSGPIILCGGSEFEATATAINQKAMSLTELIDPHVVILPAAATDNPRKTGRIGIKTLSDLGARTEIITSVSSHYDGTEIVPGDYSHLLPIETADVLYFPDGSPLDMVEGLRDGEALAAVSRQWERGAVLFASGAAAMALCDYYWDDGVWEPGLGLLKGIAVLPHFQHVAGRFSAVRLREGLPPEYNLIGIDDSTGIVITESTVTVVGPEVVTVCRVGEEEQEYMDGESFTLVQG